MTPTHLALIRAESRIIERLSKIEVQLDGGDTELWREYASLAKALAAIVPELRPEMMAHVLTQKELAGRLAVSTRTIRRRVKRGELPSKRRDVR